MPRINPTLPADGNTASAASVDTPFDTIINLLNGGLDFDNLADGGVTAAKLAAGAVTASAISAEVAQGWLPLSVTPTVATGYNKGQKEFALTFAGIDLSAVLSPGMRLKVLRTGTTPTQSMAFTAASSQYATKASPSGLSFTTTYTLEAWVYLNSYTAGQVGIVSGYNGTNGFVLSVLSSGQLSLNAGSSTHQDSYQSLPLKRWVHVAGTFSSGTMNLYFNGVLVPSAKTGSSTSITQAGALQVGAFNSTGFFDGYLSGVRVWSAAQTQTQIQDNMAISLAGSESNLVALFQGNGNFNDKTSNANNLTATGGAIATQAANPYNATEYAIITAVAFSTNTTVTIFAGTDYTIPLATLGAASYATVKTPFGFPASRGKWKADAIYRAQVSLAINNTTSQLTGGQLMLPTGAWKLSHSGSYKATTGVGTTFLGGFFGFSTATNSLSADLEGSHLFLSSGSAALTEMDGAGAVSQQDYTVAALTTLYLDVATSANFTMYYGSTASGSPPTVLAAESAYL